MMNIINYQMLKNKHNQNFKSVNLKLEHYRKGLDDKEDLDDMTPLEGDEEVKEKKGLKF